MHQNMEIVKERLSGPTERRLRRMMEQECCYIVESPVESLEKDRAIITMPTGRSEEEHEEETDSENEEPEGRRITER